MPGPMPASLFDVRGEPADVVRRIDAAAQHVHTPCGDGEMAWRCWGQSVDGKPPLVLLHGGSGSWLHWIKVIPALAATREVWAADLPGLGDSSMPAPPFTPSNSGAVVAAGIDQIFPGDLRVDLLGFSFGAHVGTFTAAALGTKIASFTICGSAALGLVHNKLQLDRERSTMSAAEREAVHRNTLSRLMFAVPRRIDPLALYVQAENVRRARFRSRDFAGSAEIAETLPQVTAPLRAIWGALDVLATPSVDARYGILRRHHPELQTRTIADAGHWVAYEQPQAFVRAVLELT